MPTRFFIYDLTLKKRGRRWMWTVTTENRVILFGLEHSRAAASYKANSALLLLLLSAPYRSRLSPSASQQARARH
jgi:hypothetical protein